MIPRRSLSVHTETLNDEVCIYDWTRKEVHALNGTAAHVWQMCDGRTSVSEMADRLRAELNVSYTEDLVWLALTQFEEKHLIEGNVAIPSHRPALSRRDLILKLGLTAALLPVVTSIVAPPALQAQSASSQTFSYTGASQTFTVPAGVTSIGIGASGGEGGIGYVSAAVAPGGKGGSVQARMTVTPGESLTVNVGGAGANFYGSSPGAGGFNGGGNGGGTVAGGGGGASDVRRGGTKLVVAGGGGGGGMQAAGGYGGGLTAADGQTGYPGSGGGGGAGTQVAGGSGGSLGTSGVSGTSGSAGTGGSGGAMGTYTGGGGGGGYYGGGGGGSSTGGATPYTSGGGGGGGSSCTDPGATSVTHVQGNRSGDGQVVISW